MIAGSKLQKCTEIAELSKSLGNKSKSQTCFAFAPCATAEREREITMLRVEEEEFYMLRPVNKTDHMQQGINVLA